MRGQHRVPAEVTDLGYNMGVPPHSPSVKQGREKAVVSTRLARFSTKQDSLYEVFNSRPNEREQRFCLAEARFFCGHMQPFVE